MKFAVLNGKYHTIVAVIDDREAIKSVAIYKSEISV